MLEPLAGVELAVGRAGIRYQGRDDLLLMRLAPGTRVAGMFTRNRCPGAPVDWCREALEGGRARGLVVNSGNANVFTGRHGAARSPPAPPRTPPPQLDRLQAAQAGVPRLHRRHRRDPARTTASTAIAARSRTRRLDAGWLGSQAAAAPS